MSTNEKKWYALYTRYRHEKRVESQLLQKGIETYLPMRKILRKWSDRKKWITEPLFNCYVFIYSDKALGNGVFSSIRDIVYIPPETFDKIKTIDIADEVGKMTEKLSKSSIPYILMRGPHGPCPWQSFYRSFR